MHATTTIALTEGELRALCWALDNYLPGLRFDEVRIDRGRDRHEVVMREELLTRLRERLGQIMSSSD